ncbi:MAG: imidazole glycerol phosphate synthase cyclase subunit [Fimbriimonadaceae bacterium]|nr:imidazole glycerol phosphate synthase cyclase subunit [Alphaproteobacteria bacterium]
MLRKRLITVLTFNHGVLFRTKFFTPDYRYTHNFVDAWLVDEIVALDVTRPDTRVEGVASFGEVIGQIARRCFVPLAAGGGIRSLEHAHRFLNYGADKVVINTGALERPALITEIAQQYGAQCVVLSMDVRRVEGKYEVYSHFGSRSTGRDPAVWAKEAESLGAGEILVTSVERDGSLQGYDNDLCHTISIAVGIPLLVSGGAGAWTHFVEGIAKGGADGVCTTNIYHFTESSVRSAKSFMEKAGIAVRTG